MVYVFTTLPNAAIRKQIGTEAFNARIQVSREASETDLSFGHTLVALCEKEMRQEFADLGINFVDDPGSTSTTMGFGRRLVLNETVNLAKSRKKNTDPVPVLFWREPEKNMARWITEIAIPIEDRIADIVIPGRLSLSSYPTWSQPWEKLISRYASKVIGVEADYCMGPRAFTLEMAEQYFLTYPNDCHDMPDRHDCIFNPILHSVRKGAKVVPVLTGFQYPLAQRIAEEDDIKTMDKRVLVVLPELCGAMRNYDNWLKKRAA